MINKFRLFNIILVLTIAFIMNGCGSDSDFDFETLEKGTYSGYNTMCEDISENLQEATLFKIDSQKMLESFWIKHNCLLTPKPELPIVNFDYEMLIALLDTMKSTGGYSITIHKLAENDGNIDINSIQQAAGSGCAVTQAFSQPFHIIKTSKNDKPLTLLYTTETINCDSDL